MNYAIIKKRLADYETDKLKKLFAGGAILVFFLVLTIITTLAGHEVAGAGDAFMAGPVISEFMPANSYSYYDQNGEAADWIELTNTGIEEIDLHGYSLSDSKTQPGKFIFGNIRLKPGEYIIVFATGKKERGALNASFALKSSGEEVVLFNSSGDIVDMIDFGETAEDQSYVRNLKTGAIELTKDITPGFANTEKGRRLFLKSLDSETPQLVINEICSQNYSVIKDEDGEYSGWVELINPSNKAVDLSEFSLTDTMDKPLKWKLPKKNLDPGDCLLIFLSGKTGSENQLHASFRLTGGESEVFLTSRYGISVDTVKIPGRVKPDESYGRSSGAWQIITEPTPGYPNTPQGQTDYYKEFIQQNTAGLYINEAMLANKTVLTDSAGNACDWIELSNRSSKSINLNTFYLTDNSKNLSRFRLPDKELAAGGFVVIYADGKNNAISNEIHTSFSLSTGETLLLSNENGIVDKLRTGFDNAGSPSMVSLGKSADLETQYMAAATPGKANKAGCASVTQKPRFSVKGGVYEQGGFSVTLSVADGSQIRYTTDCTQPDSRSAVYNKPFTINKTMVIRAQAFKEGVVTGQSASVTYIIEPNHDLPAVCLVTEPDLLFSQSKGIYVNYEAQTEVPAHIEFYDNGAQELDQNFALRIFGAYSRANAAKSFALVACPDYGPGSFNCKLFNTQPYTDYDSFILRNGASETMVTKIVDVTLRSLAKDTTRLATQDFRPCVVYINGKYWGVYFLMEKVNKGFISRHYGVPKDSVNILRANGGSVLAGEKTDYVNLFNYVKTHDLTNTQNYAYVCSQMDVSDYMDYVICEMYFNNTDTGNIKYWMSEDYDGRWRWILYDVDWSFWFKDMNGLRSFTDPRGNGVGHFFNNDILLGLLKNKEFKEQFIERFAFHINVTFEPERVIKRFDEVAGMIDSEMARDKARWGGSYSGWADAVAEKQEYAKHRNITAKQQLKEYFNLTDKRMKELFK